jgi:hypothetical protein
MTLKHYGSNQTLLVTAKAAIFFSYETPVAVLTFGPGSLGKYFRTDRFYSRTTSKHINHFLDGATAEVCPQSFIDSFLQERGE